MNRNDKKPSLISSSNRSLLLFVALLALTLAILILLFFAVRGNLLDFTGANSGEKENEDLLSSIPDMLVHEEVETYYAYMADITEDPLQYVHESDSYVRDVLIYYIDGTERRSERFTITKQGEKYRVDADNIIRICDGEQLFIHYGVNQLLTEAKPYYEEVGVTSLDQLKGMLQDSENYSVQYGFNDSKKRINFSIVDLKNNIKMELQVTLETGLVYAEQYYYNDVLYKVVYTENLTLPAEVEDKIFSIQE